MLYSVVVCRPLSAVAKVLVICSLAHTHTPTPPPPPLQLLPRCMQGTSMDGGQGLQCTLELQVLLSRTKGRRSGSTGSSSWVTVWERPVLFSDDAARIRELQVGGR